jgi:hypothetical protein
MDYIKKGEVYYMTESDYKWRDEDKKQDFAGQKYIFVNENHNPKIVPVVIVSVFRFQTEFMKQTPDDESTEEQYFEMLEVLPPARQLSNAFLVGEASDHCIEGGQTRARYALYFTVNDKFYYGGLCTKHSFDAFTVPVLE